MSHISNTIEELLVQYRITAAALARASGVHEAQICRIRNGSQIWVGSEDLTRIASAFCPSPNTDSMAKTHARLLHARLRDECAGPSARFITIVDNANTDSAAVGNLAHESKPVLPPRIQENLDLIAGQITRNRIVRDFIQSVANLCRGTRSPQVHAE